MSTSTEFKSTIIGSFGSKGNKKFEAVVVCKANNISSFLYRVTAWGNIVCETQDFELAHKCYENILPSPMAYYSEVVKQYSDKMLEEVWYNLNYTNPHESFAGSMSIEDWAQLVYSEMGKRGISAVRKGK